MGVTSIQDAKVLIATTKVKERGAGLKDLIHILKHNHGKASLETITNKAYLALCETLFQCLRDERSAYHHAKSHKAKSIQTHANLLQLAATALRHVINSALRTIKTTTVELIIETIIELLPGNDGRFLEHLDELPKALRALLEYQPHVERMSQACWDDTVRFCLESLSKIFSEQEEEPQDSWDTTVSSRVRTPFESTDGAPKSSLRGTDSAPRGTPRGTLSRSKRFTDEQTITAEDLVQCLRMLVKASNAPISESTDVLLNALVAFLQKRTGRGSSAALAAINAILPRTILSKSQLSEQVVRELLPLLRSLWSEPAIRDEIMITLTYIEAHLCHLVATDGDDLLRTDLEALVEALYSDYRRRHETTAHQFLEEDYLCFRRVGGIAANAHPQSTHTFSMDTENVRYESLWTTVATIARLSAILDNRKRTLAHGKEREEGLATKRHRITHHLGEYLRHVSEPRSNAKRSALQVLAFMVQEVPLDDDQILTVLEKLTVVISTENSVHSSWAMITLAATAFQKHATNPALKPYWSSVWQSASRAITSLSSCRAACHLMDVLLKLDVVSFSTATTSVQSMLFSVELSGPAVLTETSAAFMTTVVRERVKENPTSHGMTAERILNWLFGKWTPHLWAERTSTSLNAHHCDARDILSLLHACLDCSFAPVRASTFQMLGPIAQARRRTKNFADLSAYLLLLAPQEDFLRDLQDVSDVVDSTPSSHAVQLESRLVDFCVAELERTKSRWKAMSQQNPQGITSNMWRVITNFCIVTGALSALLERNDRPVAGLDVATDSIAQSLGQLLAKPQTEEYKMEAVLETCAASLPDINSLDTLSKTVFREAGISFLANHLSRALGSRQETKQSFYAADDDFMEVDGGLDSQMTNGTSGHEVDVPRHDIQAYGEAGALHACCATYLHLISSVADQVEDEQGTVPSEFVEHLLCKSEPDLLRSRQLVQSLLCGHFHISAVDCLKLLERLMEALIDPTAREYNSSEVANCMMVESLVGMTKVWSLEAADQSSQDVKEQTKALYDYYTRDMERSGFRASPSLQTRIADFLHGMLWFYSLSDDTKSPSVRTRLFQLLSKGEMTVKNHIAKKLPTIFEVWSLSTHDDILQDVDSHLPGDGEDLEGIAMRLLVLSKLASRWHTLLRQCVYRIFATAGVVAAAAQHASHCISEVARAKNLGDSKSLFRLFAPQVIFTWLDRKRSFAEIPHTIFGYDSLRHLLHDVESEAVGQAIMLGLESEVDYIAGELGVSVSELLAKNISKAAAYTISWDTCRGHGRNQDLPSNEQLLCKLLSKSGHEQKVNGEKRNSRMVQMAGAKHISLDQQYFPRALGYLFQTVDHEEKIKKSLEKRNLSDPALHALTRMLNNSHSSVDFNVGIEPSFSAFYLPDQVDRLCRRTFGAITSFWNPTTYTLVLRMLLDRIHPALGSLYARSLIRKIRIVVAFAGPVAYQGYPLQMTLQSLRPFLTDIQCAEDTIGIIQYLFENGVQYLSDNLSFVTGIGLSVLISLRSFLGSSQQVMTQHSQYVASMDSAKAFHTWLTAKLKEYAENLTINDRSSVNAFKLITTAASQVRLQGNSIRDSEESKLLLEILEDVRSGRKLLNTTSRDVALNLLCQDFQPAATATNDILGNDAEAAGYAPFVWESCRRGNVGHGYLRWAARVLGRAFSAFGGVERSTAHSHPWSSQDPNMKGILGRASREAIVQEVINILYSDDRKDVSLAEDALRIIVSRLSQLRRDEADEVVRNIPEDLAEALKLDLSPTPTLHQPSESLKSIAAPASHTRPASEWIKDLAVALCSAASQDDVLGALPRLLNGMSHMADKLFPYILHLVLLKEFEGDRKVRQIMSDATMVWFTSCEASHVPYVRSLVQAILYLRSQPIPKEMTRVDRDRWLEIDFLRASEAATTCGMFRTALLFAETYSGTTSVKSVSRRSSVLQEPPRLPVRLQLAIYKNLDEPDSFYGVDQGSSLSSAIDRFDYEGDGLSSMLFRGARFGSQMRRSNVLDASDSRGFISSLIKLNMDSVANALLSTDQLRDIGDEAVDYTLHTARKLGKWDIKAPELNHSESSSLYKAFQGLHYATSEANAQASIDSQLLATMEFLSGGEDSTALTKVRLRTLAALTEADELVRCGSPDRLLDSWDRMKGREKWMQTGEFDDDCKAFGLDVEASAKYEEANVLWDHGEQEKSIRIRQELVDYGNFDSQDQKISLPVLLAKLGHHVAEARSATPEKIIQNYLKPAIKELKGQTQGSDPGQVFHEFAVFCDKQLQSPEAATDSDRAKSIMDRRAQEIQDFERLIRSETNKQIRDTYKRSHHKAQVWYKLDHAEYERLRKGREELLRQCLENYLLSLQASDEYNSDALRVFSLWLEHSETTLANSAVHAHIDKVPSGKFALLMNQLSSRLQYDRTDFQKLLTHLVFRICIEHPYHGMHQIFAMQMKTANVTREDIMRSKDEAAKSRQKAADLIARELAKDKRAATIWSYLYRSNEIYHALAMFKDDKEQRSGRDIPLDRYPESKALMQKVPTYKVPPATLQIEVRADMDYSHLPRIVRFKSRMSIANGLSAPKVITAIGSDGQSYKQLYKSGNDDLRQDAIMEQVFDQVSRLLKKHTATRLRNLGIRTYKVLPLSTRSGLMEFVQNTIPLHAWLMPAHERYYPHDYKPDKCRKEIGAVQQDSLQNRVKVWNRIAENFHPVMRYFFLERFQDPDEWFERRLAYARSTAAISILGHVLGLGDRHCHNILLDEKSGEVVHIDLGVSFEAGRVLPVPEVVPFRLTRDLVDGMGYTRTEGVFRRCCEFTMDTLREERESIMTLLNVLRYDPLVNWSVTATKARRMQEQQDTNAAHRSGTVGPERTPAPSGISVADLEVQGDDKKKDEQAGEAGRALSVVEKKLSTTLSTKATVNELIQSATDERNLAVLYMGWASYA
ncbi:Serine/threonine-protein kinase tel1 [Paraconiothyrium brasiliense]|uniref:Serine/threonine-protein kinase Tel1 n=1 Tax=Paraconiothyrium brasiliense TaxID=300254 RepID=A0ABR3RKR6_9PLEO